MSEEPFELAQRVNSFDDLVDFIRALERYVHRPPPAEHVNTSTEDFLEAMSAWMKDTSKVPDTEFYRRLHGDVSWRTFAWILLGAVGYE